MGNCEVCDRNTAKYKCTVCFIPFCSVDCSRKHRSSEECEKRLESVVDTIPTKISTRLAEDIDEDDVISEERLQQLGTSQEVRKFASNRRFQSALSKVCGAREPRKELDQLMKDPEFLQFADLLLQLFPRTSVNSPAVGTGTA